MWQWWYRLLEKHQHYRWKVGPTWWSPKVHGLNRWWTSTWNGWIGANAKSSHPRLMKTLWWGQVTIRGPITNTWISLMEVASRPSIHMLFLVSYLISSCALSLVWLEGPTEVIAWSKVQWMNWIKRLSWVRLGNLHATYMYLNSTRIRIVISVVRKTQYIYWLVHMIKGTSLLYSTFHHLILKLLLAGSVF